MAAVARGARTRAPPGPDTGDGALLAHTGVDRSALNPGTRPRSACPAPRAAGPPSPERRSFFERLLRRRVALGVPRAHGQAPEAQPAQQLAHRALVQPRPEAPFDEVAQIGAAPARQAAVLGRVRPRLDPPFHLGLLRRRQARLRAGAARPVGQARDALGVVAVHPVAQRLPVHAALGRRLAPRAALQHQRDRQHPTRRLRIPRPRRLPPQVRRRQFGPGDRHRHSSLPNPCPGEANHPHKRTRDHRRVNDPGPWY